jgi:hypothetical protein
MIGEPANLEELVGGIDERGGGGANLIDALALRQRGEDIVVSCDGDQRAPADLDIVEWRRWRN